MSIDRRTSTAFVLVVVMLAALSASADVLPASAPRVAEHTRVVSVLPPGEDGFARLDPATQEVVFGPHAEDQLAMYADLVFETEISEADIPRFFKSDDFNAVTDPANVERIERIRPGVTVFRDRFGVPHVYGDSAEDVAYGAGYVTAEDRMFEADLFRRAGRGELAQFLGPDFLPMDEAARRDGYTEAELLAQIRALPERFGDSGRRIVVGLEAFAAGFNQRVAEVLANPAMLMPVEYVGTGNLPAPWRETDTVAEAVLLSRTFGEAAGAEVRNAALYKGLIATFGSETEARKALDDLRWLNDPAAATTVPAEDGAFTYPQTGPVDPAAIALPDHAADIYRGEVARLAKLSELLPVLASGGASNAMLVAPSESETGNSLQLGDPQVSYAVPQYLMEVSLHGGGYDAAGMTFPGVSGFVLIGHGRDYAWTVTSGISDAVDVRAERLCDPDGGPVSPDSNRYLFGGECRAMEERVETILVKNSSPVDPDAPQLDAEVLRVQRTVHGPVFARDTVGGVPVALVKERAFWGRELDNAAAFGAFNFSDLIGSAQDFGAAASNIVVSLNLYYADRDTIAYWHTGRYPVRTQGVEPRLPTWGTGEWEWSGNIPFSAQPHFVTGRNDASLGRHYTYNWNNKPATGWANGDDTNWGEIHRVDALVSQMDAALAGAGKMNRVDVINIMNSAATVDPRVAKLMPLVASLTDVTADPRLAHALEVLGAWAADGPAPGAHRIDRNKDGLYDRGNAVRIWDAWNEKLVSGIFFDEIGGLAHLLGVGIVDAPGATGSAYFDGMFNHVLHVLGESPSLPPLHNWLGDVSKTEVVTRALRAALDSLGVGSASDIDALRMAREEIVFSPLGAHAPIAIHWVNRGTWTHIAELVGRRAF